MSVLVLLRLLPAPPPPLFRTVGPGHHRRRRTSGLLLSWALSHARLDAFEERGDAIWYMSHVE
jgi:hypothetical protein